MKKKEIDNKWIQFHKQEFEAYIDLEGNIVYMGNFNSKYEVIRIHNSGIREKLYIGNSEKVANNWLNKIIKGRDETPNWLNKIMGGRNEKD